VDEEVICSAAPVVVKIPESRIFIPEVVIVLPVEPAPLPMFGGWFIGAKGSSLKEERRRPEAGENQARS
jgi:hypothetical protein